MSDKFKPSCDQITDILPDPFVIIDHIVATNKKYTQCFDLGSE